MQFTATSLSDFEYQRTSSGWNPPLKSNSFHIIKDNRAEGDINLYCDDINTFDLYTHSGTVQAGNFLVGDIENSNYKSLTVITGTTLIVDSSFTLSNATMVVHGTLQLDPGAMVNINKDSELILYSDSTLIIPDNVTFNIEYGSRILVYGNVNIALSNVNTFTDHAGIIIDTAAVLNITGIPYTGREYSLTDYEYDLRSDIIGPYTQGEHISDYSRIGYTWYAGTPVNSSQVIDLEILGGNSILGDYKLSILGTQETIVNDRQYIRSLKISRNSTLYIAEEFEGFRYLNPELYLGITIGNSDIPGICECVGNIIITGMNSKLTIDRHAYLYVASSGSVTVSDRGSIVSNNNDASIALYIDGTVTIDTIDQLKGFEPEQIVFGDHGKLIILNPDIGRRQLLWTTPNGIKSSELYRLFEGRLEHIEYHIQNNNGIGLDQHYSNYSVYMKEWYNGMRIEKAIKEGLIIWHSGAFIEFYADVDDTVTTDCTLYDAAKFFKSYGSTSDEILQDVVNHFKYAGSGNITFRFVESPDIYKDVSLVLDDTNIESITNQSRSDTYTLAVDNTGDLFMRNRVRSTNQDYLIQDDSKHSILSKGNNSVTII